MHQQNLSGVVAATCCQKINLPEDQPSYMSYMPEIHQVYCIKIDIDVTHNIMKDVTVSNNFGTFAGYISTSYAG
jgi:hypothetical protein